MMEKLLAKRYWLFSGLTYYASGGMRDFHGSFDTEDEAKAKFKEWCENKSHDWYQIVDIQNEAIKENGKACNPMGMLQ